MMPAKGNSDLFVSNGASSSMNMQPGLSVPPALIRTGSSEDLGAAESLDTAAAAATQIQDSPKAPMAFKSPQGKSTGSVLGGGGGGGARTIIAGTVRGYSDEEEEDDVVESSNLEVATRERIQTLSIPKLLMSKKLGNQERRAADLMKKLKADPSTNALPILDLKNHLHLVAIAKKVAIRSSSLPPEEEFNAGLKELHAAKVKFPVEYQTWMFTRSMNARLNAFNPAEKTENEHLKTLLLSLVPWGQTDFDPLHPCLNSLDLVASKRLRSFQVLVMERIFIPALAGGEKKAEVAVLLSERCLAMFEDIPEDAELTEAASNIVLDCLTCWRCVFGLNSAARRVIHAFTDDANAIEECVLALKQMASESGKNIKTLAGKVLMDCKFWKDIITEFLETRTAEKEFEKPLENMHRQLKLVTTADDKARTAIMEASDLHLQIAEKLASESYATFSASLVAAISSYHLHVIATDQISRQSLQVASELLQHVSIALPHEVLICDMQQELASKMRSLDGVEKSTHIDCATKAILQTTDETIDAKIDEIISSLSMCKGFACGENLQTSLGNAFDHVLAQAGMALEKTGVRAISGALSAAEHLAPFMSSEEAALAVVDCIMAVRDASLFMDKTNVTAEGFKLTDYKLDSFKEFLKLNVKATKSLTDMQAKIASPMAAHETVHHIIPAVIVQAQAFAKSGKEHFIKAAEERLATTCTTTHAVIGGDEVLHSWYDEADDVGELLIETFLETATAKLLDGGIDARDVTKHRDMLVQDRTEVAIIGPF